MNKKAKCFSLLHMMAVFVMGGLGYGAIEILWRGATHWSMLLTGGICLLILEQVVPGASPSLGFLVSLFQNPSNLYPKT